MSDQHLFLSDVHYGSLRAASGERLHHDLISLVQHCKKNRIRLTILGDLFDWWMEYPDGQHPQFGDPVLQTLTQYMDDMGTILFITGNHDNWTRDYLSGIGFDVEAESRTIQLNRSEVLLLHGDGLRDPAMNLPRPFWHRILRHPVFTRLYQTLLPPNKGFALMRRFSEWSRHRTEENPARLTRWAGNYLRKNSADFVICGHDHTPRIEHFPYGTLINCGAFITHRSLVLYTRGEFRIVMWNSEHRQFLPADKQPHQTTT